MRISLRLKTVIMIFIFTAVLCVASIIGTNIALTSIIRQQFIDKAESLANAMTEIIDKNQVRHVRDEVMQIYNRTEEKVSNEEWGSEEHTAYVNLYSDILTMDDFILLQNWLRAIQDQGRFEYIYIMVPDNDNARMIYVVDASYDEEMCMPGSFDLFTENDYAVLEHPMDGLPVDIEETENYGWTVALGKPIVDENGQILGYFCADSSMTKITKIKNDYLLIIAAILVGFAVLTGILGVVLVDRFVIRPVNILSKASIEYCSEDNKNERHKFRDLQIHSRDEIGDLSTSMVQMEKDINDHVATLIKTANELIEAREKEEELMKAANVDALTQVRNKRAFVSAEEELDRRIKAGPVRFGVVVVDMNNLKTINDTYGHEKGDEAIRDLCGIICSTFMHSPVFRIGGDEFVVVLEKSDLDNREALIGEFYEAVAREEKKKSWRGMSAALGCRVYDPDTDNNFMDVFKAADAEMYRTKVRMKGSAAR